MDLFQVYNYINSHQNESPIGSTRVNSWNVLMQGCTCEQFIAPTNTGAAWQRSINFPWISRNIMAA